MTRFVASLQDVIKLNCSDLFNSVNIAGYDMINSSELHHKSDLICNASIQDKKQIKSENSFGLQKKEF